MSTLLVRVFSFDFIKEDARKKVGEATSIKCAFKVDRGNTFIFAVHTSETYQALTL